jgi:hypothetical protein
VYVPRRTPWTFTALALSDSPSGTPLDDEQDDELVQRYPALAARFR